MKKFVILYQAPISAQEQMAKATPEQAKAGMDAWMAWAKKVDKAIADLGSPVGNAASVGKGGTSAGTNSIAGYSILQANSMDAVKGLLEGHPHLMMPGFTIQVLEALPLPGM